MSRTVTPRTVTVFTGTTEDGGMAFADTTVLLIRMTAAHVRCWSWAGDMWDGTTPTHGYEVRDATGALLGALLPLGHMARHCHVEWYDPAAADFFPAGETDAVLTQGIARILGQRTRHVGPVPAGEDFAGLRYPRRRNRFCPWNNCFDPECPDHGPIWAEAA
ncbi:hypothetical protein [Streptomyces qinglanensis]|uniref:hypothetical protein n=1 Tax=Streptomyces qinglanensis TaxID=943816 RepID=UPI003D737967